MEEFGKSGGVVSSPATCLPVHVPSPTPEPAPNSQMSSASRRSSPTSALLAPAGRRPGGESEPPTPCVPSPAESAPSSWRSSASPTASAPSSWKSSASPVASSAPRQRASPCTSQVRPSRHRAHGRVRQVRWRRPLAGDVPPRARPKSDRVGTELTKEFGKSGGVVHAPATCLHMMMISTCVAMHVPKSDPGVGTEPPHLGSKSGGCKYDLLRSVLAPASKGE